MQDAALAKPDIATLKAAYIEWKAVAEKWRETIKPLDDELQIVIEATERGHRERFLDSYQAFESAEKSAIRAESDLRAAILAHYETTHEKTIDANLSVQVRTSFEYVIADAVAWAETNAPVLIKRSVDAKAFEKNFAESCDFVAKIEKPSAVIKGL